MPVEPIAISVSATKPFRRRWRADPALPFLPSRLARRVDERDARKASWDDGSLCDWSGNRRYWDNDLAPARPDVDDDGMFPWDDPSLDLVDASYPSDPEIGSSSSSSDGAFEAQLSKHVDHPAPTRTTSDIAAPCTPGPVLTETTNSAEMSNSKTRRASLGNAPSLLTRALHAQSILELKSLPSSPSVDLMHARGIPIVGRVEPERPQTPHTTTEETPRARCPAFQETPSVRRSSSVARLSTVSAPTTPGVRENSPLPRRPASEQDLLALSSITSASPAARAFTGWTASFSRVLGFNIALPPRPGRPSAVETTPRRVSEPILPSTVAISTSPEADDDTDLSAALSREHVFAITFFYVFQTPLARTCRQFGTYVKRITSDGGSSSSSSSSAASSPTTPGPPFADSTTMAPSIFHSELPPGAPGRPIVKILYKDGHHDVFSPVGMTVIELARRIAVHPRAVMRQRRLSLA